MTLETASPPSVTDDALFIPDDLEDLEIPTPEELHSMIVALKFRVTKLEEEIHVD